MKQLVVFLLMSLLVACSTEESNTEKDLVKEEVLVEIKNGIYTEWYPGKKQVKYKGGQDEENRRHGVWTFFSDNYQSDQTEFWTSNLDSQYPESQSVGFQIYDNEDAWLDLHSLKSKGKYVRCVKD